MLQDMASLPTISLDTLPDYIEQKFQRRCRKQWLRRMLKGKRVPFGCVETFYFVRDINWWASNLDENAWPKNSDVRSNSSGRDLVASDNTTKS